MIGLNKLQRLAAAGLVALALAGCDTRPTDAPAPIPVARALKEAGLTPPAPVKLLAEEKEARTLSEGAGFWLLSTGGPASLPGDVIEIPSSSVLALLEKHLGSGQVGSAGDKLAKSSEWKAGAVTWRATALSTDKGHFLYLERYR